MRTTKPISTISFNTTSYLKLKLDELVKCGKLSFYAFVHHKAEDDEGGSKDHHHVYVEPAKMIQTDDLKEELRELDLHNLQGKPLGCLPFKTSKFDPWYLYGLHDKRYLAMKGQSRRFHYTHEDIVTSDDDNLLFLARSIDLVALSPYADMEDAQKAGVSWPEYFARGTVPIPQLHQYQNAWNLLLSTRTFRDGRENHPIEIDDDTGEVLQAPDESNLVELNVDEPLPF